MSNITKIFLFLATLLPSLLLASSPERIRQRDYEAVQEFINSKRTIPLAGKRKELKISGSARVNIINRQEKENGVNLRGGDTGVQRWDFDSEFNLKMAYKCDKTYGKLRLQSYNPMGTEVSFLGCARDPNGLQGSGRCSDMCLREAWMGYHLFDEKCYYVDVELGRRRLYNIFDSRIEFNERFDGLTVKALRHLDDKSDAFVRGAAFVVDYRVNHYAYAAETGIFNVRNTNIDLKYAWIYWKLHGRNQCNVKNPLDTCFNNSQWSAAYNFKPNILGCTRAKFYGAFLVNFDASDLLARPTPQEDLRNVGKQNIGWYFGFIAGDEELNKPGDWAFDINWQYVEAQAVSDRDARGIRRGNVRRDTLNGPNQRGNTNYKGLHVEAVYAITARLSIDAMYQYSKEIEKQIGGTHFYNKFEVDFIYSF